MKRLISTTCILGAALALALSACSSKEPVAFNTLEDARTTARDNGLFNAQQYRADNPRFDEGFKIVSHGDSTQTAECPQGDGWASVAIMRVAGKEVEKYTAKCSTVSAALGCYLDKDFEKKAFARQENHCDASLPFPLQKLAK